MGVSPASRAIQALNDWQIGLIYEMAMNYPIDGVRKCYSDKKKAISNYDDADLLDTDMGYSMEDIAKMKGY